MKTISIHALAAALASVTAAPLAAHETGETVPETQVAPVAEADVDPYIWLEEARSPEALAWVAKENERTLAAFESDLAAVARAGFLALVSASGGLAESRTGTAANPFLFMCRAFCRAQIFKSYCHFIPLKTHVR